MMERLLLNLSMLVAMCVFSGFVMDRWPTRKKWTFWVEGFLFGLVAVVGMLIPVSMQAGYFFDGRTVVLSLAAWYFGWRAALVSGGMAGVARIVLGGPGAFTGTLVILTASFMGLLFRRWVDPVKEKATTLQTLSLALATDVGRFGLLIVMVPPVAKDFIFEQMLIPSFLFFPIATLLVGRILMGQQENLRNVATLKESESRFRDLFEHSQVMMLLVETESGRIVDANEAASRYYGWSIEQMQGMKMPEIHVPKTETLSGDNNIAYARENENILHHTHRLASGKEREVDVYLSTVTDAKRSYLCLMVFDVFQREESEQKLRMALEEKTLVLQTSINGYQILDVEGRILEVNDSMCEMSGYSREELLGMPVTDFTPDEDPDSIKTIMNTIISQGGARLERRGRHKEGRMVLVDISARAIEIDGAVRICCFYRDITEIREREKLMRLHSAALEAAANQVVITDTEGKIEWANRAFTAGSGYGLDEAVRKEPGELLKSGIHDSGYYQQMWNCIQKGEIWRGELINRHKDGHLYEEDMTITPLLDSDGAITHYIAIKQDITEKKQMERMFHQAQRMEGIGSLSSGIAHDLNNILSPIMLSAELLTSSLPEGADRELAELILRGTARGAEIIQQLLSYAKGAQGDKIEVNVVTLLKEVQKMYRGTFPPNIRLVDEVDKDLWQIRADPSQLHQIFSNLLVNARDAMPDAGGEIRLEAKNQLVDENWAGRHPPAVPGKFVRLAVEDNGSGMSEDILQKVFDPFFTTKEEGKGTGIGLPTILGLVKGHGGFLQVTSTPGEGSRFEVYIPVYEEQKAEKHPPREKEGSPSPGGGEQILVVDDEESVRLMLKNSLGNLGYEVEIAEDAEKALSRLEKEPKPDLILLDFMMPGMNGDKLLEEIDRRGIKIPALIISGMIPESNLTDGKVLGRSILYKPFSILKLAERIREVLAKAES
jgi:PAS domain S-box-containing protein